MTAPLMLDISRLLARAQRGAPTGIDRVEHAYAEQLLRLAPDRLRFVAIDKLDRLRRLPTGPTRRFIAMLTAQWRGEPIAAAGVGAAARMIWVRAVLRPTLPQPLRPSGPAPFYLLVSHRHLHRQDKLQRAIAASGARLVVFVHDLIPIEYPEYVRPQHAELHQRRIRAVAALAQAVVVNSRATAQALQPFLEEAGRSPPVLVVPLGVPPRPTETNLDVPRPYFVCISTIEPRKNHLMLLHVWRQLAKSMGEQTPHLVLVGRRGWEIENVVDMLERSPAIRAHVTEWTEVSDGKIGALLRGSRALLFASFAEGYGLPVAEALSAGVPVICSDIPSVREVGGDVPEYLDPVDGMGWLRAIQDYSGDDSPRRAAQLARMRNWSATSWSGHVETVLGFLNEVGGVGAASAEAATQRAAPVRSLTPGLAARLPLGSR